VKKLLDLFPRRHRPDSAALSALLDGALGPRERAAAEAHVASCAACAARVAELRDVKLLLAAMPRAEAPRAFRVRESDVEAPARPAPRPSPALKWLPAVSGVAMAVFVVVLGADLATRGDDDASGTAAFSSLESAEMRNLAGGGEQAGMPAGDAAAPEGGIAADDGALLDRQSPPPLAPAPPAPPQVGIAAPDTAPPAPVPTIDATWTYSRNGTAVSGEGYIQFSSPEAIRDIADRDWYEAASDASTSGDDDGGRTGYRVAEAVALAIGLGALAVAGGAWFARRRDNRG
jgi:anti-sigma factor RsiW